MPSRERSGAGESAWRQAYQARMADGDDSCPEHEELAGLVMGEIAVDERADLADHIAVCRRCAEDYRTLVALHHEAGGARTRRKVHWRKIGVAATLIVAIGLATVWLAVPVPDSPPGDVVRGGPTATVTPTDGAVLTEPPAFEWPAQAGATGYRVRLYDEAAEALWESQPVEDAWTSLAADDAPRLTPGAAYFWVVEVEGTVARRQLGPFWFRLEE